MGTYIKNTYLETEIKIGVYKPGFTECYYPYWALIKFLKGGYESKEIIQSFLDKWKEVNVYDYKKFDTKKLYRILVTGSGVIRIKQILSNWAEEGLTIRFMEEESDVNIASEYTKNVLISEAKENNLILHFIEYDPNKKHSEIIEKIDDFDSEELPY